MMTKAAAWRPRSPHETRKLLIIEVYNIIEILSFKLVDQNHSGPLGC
jgi:hypothetical protein